MPRQMLYRKAVEADEEDVNALVTLALLLQVMREATECCSSPSVSRF